MENIDIFLIWKKSWPYGQMKLLKTGQKNWSKKASQKELVKKSWPNTAPKHDYRQVAESHIKEAHVPSPF